MPRGTTSICKCGHPSSYHLKRSGCGAAWNPNSKEYESAPPCKCKEFCKPEWEITTF